jgi:hypothetical protein
MPAIPSMVATILRLANDSLTVSRPGAVTYDSTGTAVSAAASSLSVSRVYAQRPASRGMLQHLGEGDRQRRSVELWTPTELKLRDLVTLADGEIYELQTVEPWGTTAGFWHCLGLKSAQAGTNVPG